MCFFSCRRNKRQGDSDASQRHAGYAERPSRSFCKSTQKTDLVQEQLRELWGSSVTCHARALRRCARLQDRLRSLRGRCTGCIRRFHGGKTPAGQGCPRAPGAIGSDCRWSQRQAISGSAARRCAGGDHGRADLDMPAVASRRFYNSKLLRGKYLDETGWNLLQ